MRRNGTIREKEQDQYNAEMMKIEAAALGAFQQDVSSNPKLAREMGKGGSKSLLDSLPVINCAAPSSYGGGGRFGDQASTSESAALVRGRERALETIAKKMEKKSKWLEAKTAEGETYYWNRDSYGKLDSYKSSSRSSILSFPYRNGVDETERRLSHCRRTRHNELDECAAGGQWPSRRRRLQAQPVRQVEHGERPAVRREYDRSQAA